MKAFDRISIVVNFVLMAFLAYSIYSVHAERKALTDDRTWVRADQHLRAHAEGWNDGFNQALDAMALLNLEQQMTGTNRTFGEMNAVLRQRFQVPEPPRPSTP